MQNASSSTSLNILRWHDYLNAYSFSLYCLLLLNRGKNKNNLFLFRLTATAHKSLRVGNDQLRVFSTTEKSPSGFLHDNHFPLLESSLVALTTWKVLWLTLFFLPFTQFLRRVVLHTVFHLGDLKNWWKP